MSEYLITEIDATPNIDLMCGVEVVGGDGDGLLETIDVRRPPSGAVDTLPAAALFVLIGAEPFTQWLPSDVARDDWGFVMTGPSEATPSRLPFESTLPGVFAVGDVRRDSTKRVRQLPEKVPCAYGLCTSTSPSNATLAWARVRGHHQIEAGACVRHIDLAGQRETHKGNGVQFCHVCDLRGLERSRLERPRAERRERYEIYDLRRARAQRKSPRLVTCPRRHPRSCQRSTRDPIAGN